VPFEFRGDLGETVNLLHAQRDDHLAASAPFDSETGEDGLVDETVALGVAPRGAQG